MVISKTIKCSVEGCTKFKMGRGKCSTHYYRELRRERGIPISTNIIYEPNSKCLVPDCNAPIKAKHLCINHYAHHNGKKYRLELRLELFEILGGAKCIRCGFTDIRALQFDHINGDGYKDKIIATGSLTGNSSRMNYYINRPNEFKSKYQVLCANCNWIKKDEKKEVGNIHYKDKQYLLAQYAITGT